jgi:hypothetical protein
MPQKKSPTRFSSQKYSLKHLRVGFGALGSQSVRARAIGSVRLEADIGPRKSNVRFQAMLRLSDKEMARIKREAIFAFPPLRLP